MEIAYNYLFRNIHKNINFRSERCYVIRNEDASGNTPQEFITNWNCGIASIKKVLAQANSAGKKVRVIGGTWSLSDVQQTNDYLINANNLNNVRVGLQTNEIEPGLINDRYNYCLSQCGASVMEVNKKLLFHKKSLSTSGASDGQSIAGAISTGTHGAAFTFGSMPDFVEGLHIIVSADTHYWIEGNNRIVSDTFINNYAGGAIRINSDDVLNAAIVSFGSFGIIHAVLLKVEPLYQLRHYQKYMPWDKIKHCMNGPENISSLGISTAGLYSFAIISNPYNKEMMVVNAMIKEPYTAVNPPAIPPGFGPSEDALEFIGKIADTFPHTVQYIMKAMDTTIKKQYPLVDGRANVPCWIFRGGTTTEKGKALSIEIGINANIAAHVADMVFQLVEQHPFPGLIVFRYVKKTKATLGFTKYPVTCTVELPGMHSSTTKNFFEALYLALDNAGIEYTFHWGQCNNLNNVNVRQKYGEHKIQSWLNARYQLLKTPQQQAMFSNKFTERLGLDILNPAPPITPLIA